MAFFSILTSALRFTILWQLLLESDAEKLDFKLNKNILHLRFHNAGLLLVNVIYYKIIFP